MTSPRPLTPAHGIAVLGMHRSGTSALTGMLVGAGFSAGDFSDLVASDVNNPTGYHERRVTYQFNDAVLADAGGAYDDPPPREALLEGAEARRADIRTLVDTLIGEALPAPLVVKDPRIAVMLPLWSGVVGTVLRPVVILRNPLEIARSLNVREDKSIAWGLALWEHTWRSILADLRGTQTFVVHYERLLDDPSELSELLAWARDQLVPELAAQVHLESSGELVKDYRRNRASTDELLDHATATQAELWAFLGDLPSGPWTIDAPEALTRQSEGCLAVLRDSAATARTIAQLSADVAKLRAASERDEAALAALRAEYDAQATHLKFLLGQVDSLTAEMERRGRRSEELEADARRLAERTEQLAAELRSAREDAASHRAAADAAHAFAETAAVEADRLKAEAAERASELAALRQRHADVLASESWRIGSGLVRLASPRRWRRSS